MRGGAQAHLMECDDGNFYVVKFRNNPQHRRILVNELIASVFLNYLQIATPETAIVNIPASLLVANPDIHIQLGSRRLAIEPGWHFGSRYPGNPAKVMVYDFVPDLLLDKVANLDQFLGVLAFDKWIGNADARQSIFYRARLEQWSPSAGERPKQHGSSRVGRNSKSIFVANRGAKANIVRANKRKLAGWVFFIHPIKRGTLETSWD
jgi:hypothetical protein